MSNQLLSLFWLHDRQASTKQPILILTCSLFSFRIFTKNQTRSICLFNYDKINDEFSASSISKLITGCAKKGEVYLPMLKAILHKADAILLF